MSNTTLNQLLDKHAFDGSPLHVDMPAYHVPFDDEQRTGTESGVIRAAESSERLGLHPVIVIDDSDSFTRRQGSGNTREQLIEAFFGPVLRALTALHASVIVAVHEEYLNMECFQRTRQEHGALERLLAVPSIVSGQLERILDRRTQLATEAPSSQALSPAAMHSLAELNRAHTKRNLRTTLGIAHAALVAAVDRDAELIEEQDIARAAVAQLGADSST